MSNEMIERAAKAVLSVSRANYLNLTDGSEGVAKAAIEVMQEPTEEMFKSLLLDRNVCKVVWQAMIDAILK